MTHGARPAAARRVGRTHAPVVRTALWVAVGAVVWLLLAALLWTRSTTPSLHLSGLDEHRWFDAETLRRAASYEHVVRLLWIGGTATTLVALAAFAWISCRIVRRSEADTVTTGMLLGVLGLAVQWLARLPFAVLGTWWDRRHGLSHVSYLAAAFGNLLGLGGALLVVLSLLVVMLSARRLGERWTLVALPFFVGLAALATFATPYLLGQLRPLHDPKLLAAAQQLERREGVHVPIVVAPMRRVTSAPNAEAVGLGPSRRVVLWDTMLDGRFSTRELRVVIAHELGHQRRHHLPLQLGWTALFLVPTLLAVVLATRRRGGMARAEAVPVALLALAVVQLALMPARNAVSRHLETEADWVALRTTHDPAAAERLFRQFATTAYAQPNPPTWAYVVLETHPTPAQRIALAARAG